MDTLRQATLFPRLEQLPKPVNVASVPQRSPFRYPGGKTWFVPTFSYWMVHQHPKTSLLIEPFAGGGIISLTALFENLVERAMMIELDDDIAAVWETVVNGEMEWLAERIRSFEMNKDNVVRELGRVPGSCREKAFQTILKNRTFHGGILANGAGLLKYGENGKGIASRWYPATLANRLYALKQVAHRLDFRHEDGMTILADAAPYQNAVYFIDPPYTAGGKRAGRRLYKHCEIDHEFLFAQCLDLKGDFLITYDNAEEVRKLARRFGFQMRLVPMKNTHHTTMEELVIGRDLRWMDAFPSVHEPQESYELAAKKCRGNLPS